MKSGTFATWFGAIAFCAAASAGAQSTKDWIDIKDPNELKALFSNKTFRGKSPRGPFVGHYRADGKGIVIAGGARIPRTWEVKGNQVCVTDPWATNCYTYQRHKKNRNDIVGYHVKDRWISQFKVEDGIPDF